MSRRTLLNLVLVAVVAALALLAVYKPGKEAAPLAENLTELSAAQVNRIRIERPGEPVVVLERTAGKWRLSEPQALPANDQRIESVLRLAEAKVLGRFSAPEDLAPYGLARPGLVATLNDTATVAFGTTTPMDQRRYVLKDGAVHLVADTTYYYLSGGWAGFVDPRPVPADAVLTAIELPGLTVTRGEGGWRAEPAPEGLSADAVVEFVDNWKHVRAFEVKPWQGEASGERVTLRTEGEPIEFVLSGGEALALVRPDWGIAYHLAGSQADELLSLPPPAEAPHP